jgi:rhodanese-related sulfurtransferase
MAYIVKACLLTVSASLIGLGFNGLRPNSLLLVASEAYQIYQDCPEITKEAQAVNIEQFEAGIDNMVVLDARPKQIYLAGHLPNARSFPYDPLRAIDKEEIVELSKLGPGKILVYGDDVIDSGRLLAGELSSAGLLGVRYLEGGFSVWKKAGREIESRGQN